MLEHRGVILNRSTFNYNGRQFNFSNSIESRQSGVQSNRDNAQKNNTFYLHHYTSSLRFLC